MSPEARHRMQHTGDLVASGGAGARVHFVGIGGVGMSGIAEVLCTLGYQVSGSDMADNAVTRRLVALGINVTRGHAAANVLGSDCIVVSSAIKPENPELMEARAAHPDRAACGDAGRADALQARHRRGRYAWQDHHDLAAGERVG